MEIILPDSIDVHFIKYLALIYDPFSISFNFTFSRQFLEFSSNS